MSLEILPSGSLGVDSLGGGGGTPKTSTLADTFPTALNTSLWTPTNGVDTSGGRCRLPITQAGGTLDSVAQYDLTSSKVYAQVTFAGPGNGTISGGLQIGPNDPNYVTFILQPGGTSLLMRWAANFVHNDATIPYNATSMAWLQIRESGGTVFWETSPDGVTWTTQRSSTYTINLTSCIVEFWAACTGTETAGQFTFVDNVNSGGGGTGGGGGTPATLLWSDEFNGPVGTDVNAADWDTITGTSGDATQLQYNTPGGANKGMTGDGHLLITTRREAFGGRSYTSARIEGKHPITTGYVEFKIKTPVWPGLTPTTWLYGAASPNFPTTGSYTAATNFAEIDAPIVVTGGGSADPTNARLALNGDFQSDQTGAKLWQLGGTQNKYSTAPARFGDAYHTVGVFIDPADHSVTFWVDGVLFHRYTQADALALGGVAGTAARLAAGVHADNNIHSDRNSIANAYTQEAIFTGFTASNPVTWFMMESGPDAPTAQGNVQDLTNDPAGNFEDGRYKPQLNLTLYGAYVGQTCAQIAAGACDTQYINMATFLNQCGFSRVAIRWGWEVDGGWGFPGTGATVNWSDNPTAYIAAFRHVHDLFNAHLNMPVLWEWNAFSNSSYRGSDPAGYKVATTGFGAGHSTYDYYPGDAYVDVIGCDSYEYGPSAEGNILGSMKAAAAFAKSGLAGISAGGKQVGYSEFGFWDPTGSTALTNESNGRTVRVMTSILAFYDSLPPPGQPGGLAYHMYFDGNPPGGAFAWSNYPQALAVYKQRMLTVSGSGGGTADELWPYGTVPLIPVIQTVAGGLSGTPDTSVNSDSLLVDWVRYYDKPPGPLPPLQSLTIASFPVGAVAPGAATLTQSALGTRQSLTASSAPSGGVVPGSATLTSVQRLTALNFIDGGVPPQGSQQLGQVIPIRELVAKGVGSLVTVSVVFDITSGQAVRLIAGNETASPMTLVGNRHDGTELVRVTVPAISVTQEIHTFAANDLNVISDAFGQMTWRLD